MLPERSEIDFNTGLQGFFGLDRKNPTHSVTRYDPNIKAPKTDELIVGFEREVLTDFSVGVNATYRKLRDFIGTRIEKTRGAGDYVTAADYHLFTTLTGRLPFERSEDVAKLYAHVSEPPPAPSSVVDGLPKDLDRAVTRAMAKDPDFRFQSGRVCRPAAGGQTVTR